MQLAVIIHEREFKNTLLSYDNALESGLLLAIKYMKNNL